MDDLKASGYVFKVLSGALNGIEFSLGSHAYFMCVGDTTEGQENLAQNSEFAERTLYLPATGLCNNFTVNLDGEVSQKSFQVVSYLTHQETLTLAFNTICHVGGIYFALKHEGEAWSPAVVGGALPPETTKVAVEPAPVSATSRVLKWGYKSLIATTLLLLGFGSAAAWMNYQTPPLDTSPEILDQILGKHAGYAVQLGRDKVYYIFAQNTQQAEWVRQAIARSKSSDSWVVVTPNEEEARLARILDQLNIGFFTIRFTDPRNPTLIMSSTTNATDKASLDKVNKALLDALPYARKVNIELESNEKVIRLAQEGLLALGFDYQMIQSDHGVMLSSPMTTEDSRLAAFNQFVERFHRNWGRRFVHFSGELRDDWMKDKSFKYGQDGYVNVSKSHWLFNNRT